MARVPANVRSDKLIACLIWLDCGTYNKIILLRHTVLPAYLAVSGRLKLTVGEHQEAVHVIKQLMLGVGSLR